MGCPGDIAGDQVALELAQHVRGAVAAHADQPHAALREPLDGRDADLFGQALGHDLTFIERDEQGPAHRASSRLAAAIASRGLV